MEVIAVAALLTLLNVSGVAVASNAWENSNENQGVVTIESADVETENQLGVEPAKSEKSAN